MLTYKAMYKYLDKGVLAEVLDFPGVITGGLDAGGGAPVASECSETESSKR